MRLHETGLMRNITTGAHWRVSRAETCKFAALLYCHIPHTLQVVLAHCTRLRCVPAFILKAIPQPIEYYIVLYAFLDSKYASAG